MSVKRHLRNSVCFFLASGFCGAMVGVLILRIVVPKKIIDAVSEWAAGQSCCFFISSTSCYTSHPNYTDSIKCDRDVSGPVFSYYQYSCANKTKIVSSLFCQEAEEITTALDAKLSIEFTLIMMLAPAVASVIAYLAYIFITNLRGQSEQSASAANTINTRYHSANM